MYHCGEQVLALDRHHQLKHSAHMYAKFTWVKSPYTLHHALVQGFLTSFQTLQILFLQTERAVKDTTRHTVYLIT